MQEWIGCIVFMITRLILMENIKKWNGILVGKLTGCREIYPFELSSAMSGDVVTEYTLWRTLLGKYRVMIYFCFSPAPLIMLIDFLSHLHAWPSALLHLYLWSPMCGLELTLFVIFHMLYIYSRVMNFFIFLLYFPLSLLCSFVFNIFIWFELFLSFVCLHSKEDQLCFDALSITVIHKVE